MKKLVVTVVLAAGLSILFFASGALAANTIKVGIVDSYSGGAAAFGLDLLDGFKMAVAEINAKGGVLGKKIEYVTRDEKFQPAVALSMAKEARHEGACGPPHGDDQQRLRARHIAVRENGEAAVFVHLFQEREDIRRARPQVRLPHGGEHGYGRQGCGSGPCEEAVHTVLDSGRRFRVRPCDLRGDLEPPEGAEAPGAAYRADLVEGWRVGLRPLHNAGPLRPSPTSSSWAPQARR